MIEKGKVLMIAATPFFSDRGCHIRIYNEMKYLGREGVDVTLCTYHIGNDIEGLQVRRIKNVSWYKKITPGASWGKLYLDFLLFILVYKEFRRLKPNVIHAHLYEGLLIAYLVKFFSLSRVKIIFDCQGSLAEEMYAYTLHKNFLFKLAYPLFIFIEWVLLHMPNEILCSSENSLSFLVRRYPFVKNKIEILPDAADPELFHQATEQEKKEARATYNIPEGNTVIIYTGSLTQAKGAGELLEAVPEIIKKRPDVTFVFAGYGDLLETYQNKLENLIENKNVIFTGRFSYFDLPSLLAVADYAIDPKRDSTESSGKIYNYIAMGIPVICFDNDFNRKVLKDEGKYISELENIAEIAPLSYV